MNSKLLILAVTGALLSGCATIESSRKRDHEAAQALAEYRKKQRDRIEALNREYQRTFEQEMDSLNRLGFDDFKQRLELRSLAIGDDMLMRWEEKTLPGQIQSTFYAAMLQDFKAVEDIEANLDAARKAYAAAYTDVALDVKKIEAAEKALEDLALKPDTRRDLTRFLKSVYDAYRVAQKEREAEKTAGAQPAKN